MDRDLQVKLAVYGHFAQTGRPPSPDDIGDRVGIAVPDVRDAYRRLREQRVLLLDADDVSIRMAPPFSGVATQHVVVAGSVSYFANCAWDALGIPAALRQPATVRSRCEQSLAFRKLRQSCDQFQGVRGHRRPLKSNLLASLQLRRRCFEVRQPR
jgi:hypothetical protein